LLSLSRSLSIVAKIMGHRSLNRIFHYTEVKVAEEVLAGLKPPLAEGPHQVPLKARQSLLRSYSL